MIFSKVAQRTIKGTSLLIVYHSCLVFRENSEIKGRSSLTVRRAPRSPPQNERWGQYSTIAQSFPRLFLGVMVSAVYIILYALPMTDSKPYPVKVYPFF
jgi:hypothetical protein